MIPMNVRNESDFVLSLRRAWWRQHMAYRREELIRNIGQSILFGLGASSVFYVLLKLTLWMAHLMAHL